MKKLLYLPLFFALIASMPCDAKGESTLLGGAQENEIIVNNRILTKVNGKAISVIDLMKKMDVLFYRQFPQYTSSAAARFQFYQANWKHVLNEMIDKELILADAEEMKITISPGDVRQEMESMFGPNIITNLDKVGLSFEEANKMVSDDIAMRRMLYFRVQSKALSQVTPVVVRNYYEQIAKNTVRDNEWVFNVITIRHKDSSKAAETANHVHHLLVEENLSLNELLPKMDQLEPPHPSVRPSPSPKNSTPKKKSFPNLSKKFLLPFPPIATAHRIFKKAGPIIRQSSAFSTLRK